MILTIIEAAELVARPPNTIRTWVRRKQLLPVKAGAKPLKFRERDVIECAHARISKARHARLDALYQAAVENDSSDD